MGNHYDVRDSAENEDDSQDIVTKQIMLSLDEARALGLENAGPNFEDRVSSRLEIAKMNLT